MFSREDAVGLHPAPRELAARVTDEFDLLIGSGSGDLGRGFRLLIWLIEWLPILFHWHCLAREPAAAGASCRLSA